MTLDELEARIDANLATMKALAAEARDLSERAREAALDAARFRAVTDGVCDRLGGMLDGHP